MLKKVIVIGAGLAGVSAAHAALEEGEKVLLLDKSQYCGGNSIKATSGINGALTKSQIEQGISDSVEAFEKDTVLSANLGEEYIPYPLATTLTGNSLLAFEWLTMKFNIDLSIVVRLGEHSFPRTHKGGDKLPGRTITLTLLKGLEEIEKNSNGEKIKILKNAKAINLILENDIVIGVEYENNGQILKAFGSVIICTGGFASDFSEKSLLLKFRPDLVYLPTTSGVHCTGDGIKMALEAGAELVDMEWIQVHPTGLINPSDPDNKNKWLAAESLRGVGGILIDSDGDRFCNELGRRDYVSERMKSNSNIPFRLVLNSAAAKELEWECENYVKFKLMKIYQNSRELAEEMSIDTKNLEDTFNKYNESAIKGIDVFGKKYFKNASFTLDDKLYVSLVTPVIHYCMGGLKINTKSEVLGKEKVIKGLYAAGEVAGGVHGKNRLGGNSLLECVVFGRISGAEAARNITDLN